MEPETVPAKALVGARERVESLHKSMVANGTALIGEDFHAFEIMPEPAPDAQVALGMSLSATIGTAALLSKAVATVKARAEKAEADVKAEREGGVLAGERIQKLTKALLGTGSYGVCGECKGAAYVADPADKAKTQTCAKCSDLPGIVKKSAGGGKR